MPTLTESNSADVVARMFEGARDPRAREIFAALIRHVHAFVREVRPTEDEWAATIDFLTRTGQTCDDKRQEFILLSDILGVSMLVDAINHQKPAGATLSSVLGPFHRDGAPLRPAWANIAGGGIGGDSLVVDGRVTALDGTPLAGAELDVWQTAPNGFYEGQDPAQPEMNLRGKFVTDAQGRYGFRTVKPVSYQIPTDGPVGELLRAAGRHPWRPAHVHLIVAAPGYETTTTSIFIAGDPYIASDAVFGVQDALVTPYRDATPQDAEQLELPLPFARLTFDVVLVPRA